MQRWSWIAVAIVAATLLLAACGDDGNGNGTEANEPTATAEASDGTEGDGDGVTAAPAAAFEGLTGTYEGTWLNETFQTTADVTIELSIEGNAATFTLTLGEGSGGSPFGIAAPEPKVLEGAIDATGIAVELAGDDLFGDMSVAIGADGAIAAAATMGGVPGVSGLTVDGTINESGMDLRYTVTFPDGTEAGGTATLAKS